MKKIKQRLSLRNLINTIEWTKIEMRRGALILAPDEIKVQFTHSKKNSTIVDEVRVRIGRELLEQLEWTPGDKIYPAYNPDDQMLFLLVKSDTGNGYTLSQESKSSTCRIHFRCEREKVSLSLMPPTTVEFEIYKKQLIFRVGDSSVEE